VNGSGTGEMLDAIVENLPGQENLTGEEDKLPKLAVVGRPNVGKSSLINSLIGEERNIVTPISGTTRDSIFVRYQKYNHDFLLVDTAGLRKKGKVRENLEFYSVLRSVRTIENADVCLLMIDATLGVESQDLNIFHLIQRNHKGIVVLINKWDIIEKETDTAKHYKEAVKTRVAPFNDVPIIFTSAISRQRIHKVLETAIEVHENRKQKIPTSELNEVMLKAIENYPPPAYKGKYVKVKYVVQLPTYSPSFAFYCNYPQYMKEPYKRYVENQLRKHFNFTGVPIRVFFRRK
jgi:GTP-binding protein